MTLYCTECGNKHEYTIDKPRFCSRCGHSFGGEIAASTQKKSTRSQFISRSSQTEGSNDADDMDIEVPRITKIEAEIEVFNASKGVRFEDAKKCSSFARESMGSPLTVRDLEERNNTLFKHDREISRENK